MSPEEIKKKIEDLQRRAEVITKKKAAFGGQLKVKKEELASLISEIRAAGYDPKNLVAERDKAQAGLESLMTDFEKELVKSEEAMAVYEKK